MSKTAITRTTSKCQRENSYRVSAKPRALDLDAVGDLLFAAYTVMNQRTRSITRRVALRDLGFAFSSADPGLIAPPTKRPGVSAKLWRTGRRLGNWGGWLSSLKVRFTLRSSKE